MSTQYQVVDYSAACFPWQFPPGDSSTFSLPFEVQQPDGTFLPMDLDPYTVTGVVKLANEQDDQVLELTVDNGGIVLPGDGVVKLVISPANSALLTGKEYVYKVIFTTASTRRTYVEAPLTILRP